MPAQQPLTPPLAHSLAQPFSVRIQTEPLDPAAHRPALPGHASGAEVRFIGKVRNDARGGAALSHLVLEHFPGVTEGEIERIIALARQRWALQGAHVTHRVGPIAAGEDIVMVTTHSAHRRDAYEANVFIMDYLKTEAPFWKQECFADGSAHWVQAKASDQQAQRRWAQHSQSETEAGRPAPLAQRRIGALVLAGGQGSRMGHVNKGLQPLDGRPLAQHVIDALLAQVQALAISANHDLHAYRALGHPVASDAPEYQGLGPLAGIASAAAQLPPDLDAILIAPCDTPRLPADLVPRLAQALFAPGAPPVAIAATAQGLHPSIALLRPGLCIGLMQHLKEQRGLSLRSWLCAHGWASVHFDDEAAFVNVNDRQALAQLQSQP